MKLTRTVMSGLALVLIFLSIAHAQGSYISSVSPDSGSTSGGDTVIVSGFFSPPVGYVKFGGVYASIVGSPTTSSISITTPSGIPGYAAVEIADNNGPTSCPSCFQYVSAGTGPSLTNAGYDSSANQLKLWFTSPIDSVENGIQNGIRLSVDYGGSQTDTLPTFFTYAINGDEVTIDIPPVHDSIISSWTNLANLRVEIAPNVFRNTAYAWNGPIGWYSTSISGGGSSLSITSASYEASTNKLTLGFSQSVNYCYSGVTNAIRLSDDFFNTHTVTLPTSFGYNLLTNSVEITLGTSEAATLESWQNSNLMVKVQSGVFSTGVANNTLQDVQVQYNGSAAADAGIDYPKGNLTTSPDHFAGWYSGSVQTVRVLLQRDDGLQWAPGTSSWDAIGPVMQATKTDAANWDLSGNLPAFESGREYQIFLEIYDSLSGLKSVDTALFIYTGGQGAFAGIDFPRGSVSSYPNQIHGSYAGRIGPMHILVKRTDGSEWSPSSGIWMSPGMGVAMDVQMNSPDWYLDTGLPSFQAGMSYGLLLGGYDSTAGSFRTFDSTYFSHNVVGGTGPSLVSATYDSTTNKLFLSFTSSIDSVKNGVFEALRLTVDHGGMSTVAIPSGFTYGLSGNEVAVDVPSQTAGIIENWSNLDSLEVEIAVSIFRNMAAWNSAIGWSQVYVGSSGGAGQNGSPDSAGIGFPRGPVSYYPNEIMGWYTGRIGVAHVKVKKPDGSEWSTSDSLWKSPGYGSRMFVQKDTGGVWRLKDGLPQFESQTIYSLVLDAYDSTQGNMRFMDSASFSYNGGIQNEPFFHTAYYDANKNELALFCDQPIQDVNTGSVINIRKNQYNGWYELQSNWSYIVDSGAVLKISLLAGEGDSLARWFTYGGPPQVQIPSGLAGNNNGQYNGDQIKDIFFVGNDSTGPGGDSTSSGGNYVHINYPSGTVDHSPTEIGGSYGGNANGVHIAIWDNINQVWWNGQGWSTGANGPSWIQGSYGNGQWNVNSGLPNWADSGSYEVSVQISINNAWFPSQPVKTNFQYCSSCGGGSDSSGGPGGPGGEMFILSGTPEGIEICVNIPSDMPPNFSLMRKTNGSAMVVATLSDLQANSCVIDRDVTGGNTYTYFLAIEKEDGSHDSTNYRDFNFEGDSGPQFSLSAEGWHNSAHVDINAYNSQFSSYAMYRIEGSGWNLVATRSADSSTCFNFYNRPTGAEETYIAIGHRTDGGTDTTNEVTITIRDYGREDMWPHAEVGTGKQYSSIQAAIDAGDSAVIKVYPGTYDPIRIDGKKRMAIVGVEANGEVPTIDGKNGIAVLADTTTEFGRHGEFRMETFILQNATKGIRIFGQNATFKDMLIKGAGVGVEIVRNQAGQNSYDGWGYLSNLTIVGTSTGTAGVVCDTPYSGVMLRNSIITGYTNGVAVKGGNNAKVSYSDIWAVKNKYSGSVMEGPGVVEMDPAFVDAATYKLSSSSPVISQGENGEPMGAWFLSGRKDSPDGGGGPGQYGPRAEIHAESWENMAYVCVSGDRSMYKSYTLLEIKDGSLIDLGTYGLFQECRKYEGLPTGQTLYYTAALEKYSGEFDTVGICTVTVSDQTGSHGGEQGPPPVTVGPGKQFTSLQAAIDATSEGMIEVYPGEYGPITITGAKSIEIHPAEDGRGIPVILGNGGTAITIKDVIPPDVNRSGKVRVGGFIVRNASTGLYVSNAEGGIGEMLMIDVQRGVVAEGSNGPSTIGSNYGSSTRFGARNVTFIGGSGSVAAIQADENSGGEIIDCIIQGFPTGIVGGEMVIGAYNNFWQVSTKYSGQVYQWGQDLEVNPQFASDGSYRLTPGSPLVTAGSAGPMGPHFLGDPRATAQGPTNFAVRDKADDENGLVELSWAPGDTAGLVGYWLLRSERKWTPDEVMNGTALEGADFKWHMLGRVNGFVDTLPKENVDYYFLIGADYSFKPGDTTHTDPAGGWDGFVMARAHDDVRPLSATNFEAFDTPGDYGGSITLTWTPSSSGDVVKQQIVCFENLADTLTKGTGKIVMDTVPTVSQFVFTKFRDGTPIQNNKTYHLVVVALDDAGNDNRVNAATDIKSALASSNAPETMVEGRQNFGAIEVVLKGIWNGRPDTGDLTYYYSLLKGGVVKKTGSSKLGTKSFFPLSDGSYEFRAYAKAPDSTSDASPASKSFTIAGATTFSLPAGIGWNMISIPSANKPASILKSGRQVFGWKEDMQAPDVSNDRYEYNNSTIERGRGYWFRNPDSAISVSLSETDLLADQVAKDIVLLKRQNGWNQIGNPFSYAVDMSTTGLMFYSWNPSTNGYSDPGTVLEPWKAYWVKVAADVTLKVDAKPYFPAAVAKVAKAKVDDRNWVLRLEAKCGENSDINNTFGVGVLAKAAEGAVCFEPPSFNDNLSVYFVGESQTEQITRDIRASQAATQVWTFGVKGASAKPVSFQVADLGALPEQYDVYVGFRGGFRKIDKSSGQFELAQTEKNYYELVVTKDAQFPIHAGITFNLRQNFPNPVQSVTRIGYTIPATWQANGLRESNLQQVKLEIYNLSGQKLRTLVNAKQGAGYYEVSWLGTDNYSRPVSSGVYLYLLRAGDKAAQKRMVLVK